MRLSKKLSPGIVLVVFSSLITFAMLKLPHVKNDELYQSQLKRYYSYILADQLRQSSDDLTRMARTYVTTNDDKYEKMYWDILAIRNGEKPRPENMERIYWDLVLEYGDKPKKDTRAVPLRELMKQAGFSQHELLMLDLAQRNSDELVKTE
ncbi:hypothetical protein P7F88_02845 [Vibrio hannami]|uniref:hypothetical protein n=1 Tax=Vibrio hannami TaxID=2717094 RepID=UPI00240F0D17|nr:hypothetical protein [Vibrio hannami]MDG3085090.1 hypothetical protein [Vibrio hannami]